MKKVLLFGFFSLMTSGVYAQEETNDYELKADEKYGYVIDKNGKKVEGIVRLAGSDMSPWVNQKKVKFIAASEIDKSRKKQKFKTIGPDDLKEYVAFDDSNNERHFEMVKYTTPRKDSIPQTEV